MVSPTPSPSMRVMLLSKVGCTKIDLGFILFLGTVFQNSSEFLIIEHAIFDWSLSVHFIDLFVSKTISHGSQKFTKSIFMNKTCIFFIKAAKCVFNHIFWVSSLKSFSE